jgi:hypothetical protein
MLTFPAEEIDWEFRSAMLAGFVMRATLEDRQPHEVDSINPIGFPHITRLVPSTFQRQIQRCFLLLVFGTVALCQGQCSFDSDLSGGGSVEARPSFRLRA